MANDRNDRTDERPGDILGVAHANAPKTEFDRNLAREINEEGATGRLYEDEDIERDRDVVGNPDPPSGLHVED